MGLVSQLVETGASGPGRGIDILELDRPRDLRDIANLGLTLDEAKQLLTRVQQAVATIQARDHAALRPACADCGASCHVKVWQSRPIATLFGTVVVRLPRFRCPGCGRVEAGIDWPAYCRSTPELDQLHAHLSALLTYWIAAGVLAHLLPVAAGTGHETLRCRTLKLGEQLRGSAAVSPEPAAVVAVAPAPTISLSLDSTFIRSCHEGERHLEVRVGNAESPEDGGRQVFGAVANAGTDIVALIRHALDALGRTGNTALTAFTDGCSGLRAILAAAGITGPPIADWFHLSMRLQHAKQVAEALPAEDPHQQQAKTEIVAEVERLRWRTWHGKAKDARITLRRLRTLLPALEREPVRKLRRALRAVNRYLRSQSAWLVDYAERHRAGQRVGTSITEGTANFLVNKRMAKSQQMRWIRRGADLLLQVRCAVYNGALGSGFGTLFKPALGSGPHWAEAA